MQIKDTSKLHVTGLCAGNSLWPVNSPHKWPVTRKMSPFDDVIMHQRCLSCERDEPAETLLVFLPIMIIQNQCLRSDPKEYVWWMIQDPIWANASLWMTLWPKQNKAYYVHNSWFILYVSWSIERLQVCAECRHDTNFITTCGIARCHNESWHGDDTLYAGSVLLISWNPLPFWSGLVTHDLCKFPSGCPSRNTQWTCSLVSSRVHD